MFDKPTEVREIFSPEGLTFPEVWLTLLVEVDALTSLLKFEISRRVGNWSLRRSENSRIFLCHLIYTLRRRFGWHDLSGILGAAQIELVERLTAMISGKQVAVLVPHLAVLEEVALPLRKHLAFTVLSCQRVPSIVLLGSTRII